MNKQKKVTAAAGGTGQLPLGGKRPPLLAYIRGVLASLNPTDRVIAECVLKDPEKVITSSIAQLSHDCGASVGAIVGFCQQLELKGYSDFRIALARDLAQAGLSTDVGSQNGSLFEKVFQSHAQSLAETLQLNPQSSFERVAQAIEKARRIEFFAIGLSHPVAYTASCKFTLLGLQTGAQADSHMQVIAATQLNAGDVAFGISCSGATRETVQCLEVARGKGATTVCLTNAMKSPITEWSDLCLYATPSEIKYFQAPLASRVTQLAVIDALFVSLALKAKTAIAKRLQKTGEALMRRRLE
jgi:DNA-binding MurR/RpiR family transcriptional regulator